MRLLANRIGPEVFGFRAKLTGIVRSKNSPVMDQTACGWMGLKQGPCDAKSRFLVRRHSGDFGGNDEARNATGNPTRFRSMISTKMCVRDTRAGFSVPSIV